MTAVIETEELGKQYRGRWALAGCTLSIPAGHVVGLACYCFWRSTAAAPDQRHEPYVRRAAASAR
ncbi:MAG TPA: hypothetical protein VGS06_16695 [Streptosporangiaceae bacterium]|nr:hypothetical protein [Streptosporangiaceae bacterium]